MPSGNYRYRVRAYARAGDYYQYSGWKYSDTITVKHYPDQVGGWLEPGGTTLPGDSFTLAWESVGDPDPSDPVDYYQLKWSVAGSGYTFVPFVEEGLDGSDLGKNTSVTISESSTGRAIEAVEHKFRVRACNDSGCGAWRTKTLSPPTPPEAAFSEDLPEHFYELDQDITWQDVDASSYRLKRTRKGQDEPDCEVEPDGYCWSTPVPHTTDTSFFDGASDPGEYRYKLEACNDFECDTALSHWVRVHNLKNIDEDPAVQSEVPDVPGTIRYSADVGVRGNAAITVPLQAAPGVNGLQPNLSLRYTSARFQQRKNETLPEDILGYGWRLGGLSSIRRCVVNRPESDNISLNNDDSLCLDGEPLVLVSGSHWQAGAQYRTLRDSLRLVELKEDAEGNLWFQVKESDGRTSEYGTSADSRLRTEDSPHFAWSLKKVTDAFGNTMEYKYHRDTVEGINYPLEITYGNQGDAKIEFQYGTRTDAPPVPLEEIEQKQLVLLHHIRVHLDGALQREYKLISEAEPAEPDQEHTRRLKQVQLCAYGEKGGGRQCLKPLEFNWKFTDSANPEDFDTGIEKITDGLGAQTKFVLERISDASGMETVGRFDEGETLFGPVGSIPDASPLEPEGGDYRTVVTEVHRSNGYSNDAHITEYAYQGVGLVSDKHWGFLGYTAQRIYDTEADIVTYRQYRQDFPHFGKLARQIQYKGNYSFGELLTEQRFSRDSLTLDAGDGETYYPYVAQRLETVLEGGQSLGYVVTDTQPEAQQAGAAGDLIAGTVRVERTVASLQADDSDPLWGQVAPASGFSGVARSVETTTLFENRVGSDWLIGFVSARERSHYSGLVGADPDQVESVIATPMDGSNKVDTTTRYPNDPEYQVVVDYDYDQYGNLTSESATGKVDQAINGASSQTRTTSVAGGFIDRRYAAGIHNTLDQLIQLEYDPRFGKVSKVTDANQRVTETVYDPFGREDERTNPDGVTFDTDYNFCHGICPTVGEIEVPYWVSVTSDVTPDTQITPDTQRYYDQLGRLVQKDIQAFSGSFKSRREYKYDRLGRLATETAPFFADGAIAVDGHKPLTQYDYDARSRLEGVQKANGGSVDIEYTADTGNRQVKVSVTETVIGESGTSSQVKDSYYSLSGDLAKTVDDATDTAVTTDYTYYGSGLPEMVTVTGDGRNIESSFVFDRAGFRTGLSDPNLGTVTSNYSAFGQLERQTDNKGQSISYRYDRLGRLLEQEDADGLAEWQYDTANATGALASRSYTRGATQTFHEVYSYRGGDSKLDTVSTTLNAGGESKTLDHRYDYDGNGRLDKIVYPNGVEAHYQYNGRGYLSVLSARDEPGAGLVPVKTFDAVNARGQVTKETYDNQLITNRTYNPDSGRLETIDTGGGAIQDNEYKWRTNGTLESRLVYNGGEILRQEDFSYDGLNRLTQATMSVGGSRELSTQYDKLGNITGKTSSVASDADITGYQYGEFGNSGPNAVSNVNIGDMAHSLHYDPNGAITRYDAASGDDKWITWTARQLPTEIVVGDSQETQTPTARDRFQYGPDGKRFYRESSWMEGGELKTEKVFIVGSYEETLPLHDDIQTIQKTRLDGNVQHIAIGDLAGTTAEYQYLHRDHLGSVEKVTDESGAEILDTAFDPDGGRRQPDWSGDVSQQQLEELLLSQNFTTRRGYTGHEHMDRTGLIHMNGRIYDPTLGRFLSPDPIVQAPSYSQSWNRYTYTFNNPLSFVDPSGFTAENEEKKKDEIDDEDDGGGGGGGSSGGSGGSGSGNGGGSGSMEEVTVIGVQPQSSPVDISVVYLPGPGGLVPADPFASVETNFAGAQTLEEKLDEEEKEKAKEQASEEPSCDEIECVTVTADKDGNIGDSLSDLPPVPAGSLSGALEGINPVGPGGSSIPGGKGVGMVATAILKTLGKLADDNPHKELDQTGSELEDYYYNNPGSEYVCLLCHTSP